MENRAGQTSREIKGKLIMIKQYGIDCYFAFYLVKFLKLRRNICNETHTFNLFGFSSCRFLYRL